MSVKSSVLQVLEASRGHSVSGQQLAHNLGVSRSAIWKAIKALEADGYIIDAVTNKGYLLANSNDLLSAEGIGNYLINNYKQLPITVLKSVSSTNTHARMMAATGAIHGSIVVSEEQTDGKGRMGRLFFSPKDCGIYMSIILRPNTHTTNAVFITTAAAVAVCQAITKLTPVKPAIKWVNDILLDDKKICGILTEAVTDFESGMVESVVVGIGINFKKPSQPLPDELKDIIGFIFDDEKTPLISRNQLIAEISNQLISICENLDDRTFIEDYRKLSMILGEDIKFSRNNEWHFGKAISINDDGALIVKLPNGNTTCLNSGEISLRKI